MDWFSTRMGESASSPPASYDGSPTPGSAQKKDNKLDVPWFNGDIKTPPKAEDVRLRTPSFFNNNFYSTSKRYLPSLAASDRSQIAPILPVGSSQMTPPRDEVSRNPVQQSGAVVATATGRSSGLSISGGSFGSNALKLIPEVRPYVNNVEEWLSTNQPELRSTRRQRIKPTLQAPVPPSQIPSYTFTGRSYRAPSQGFGFRYPSTVVESQESTSQLSEMSKKVINDTSSFADNLVYRGLSDFSFHKPITELSCTAASIHDTVTMQAAASKLLSHAESVEIFEALSNRIERMLTIRLSATTTARGTLKRGEKVPSVHECATKLRNWLKKELNTRVELGECKGFLEHELQWAEWFVNASQKGVLHVKVAGCQCRPEWTRKWGSPVQEEEEGDEAEEY